MSEGKKQMYFYLTIGYIGVLFLVLTGFRLIWLGDSTGHTLALLSLLFIAGFWRYIERELIPKTKERLIIKSIFISLLIILFLGGCYLLFK
ncbi:hypothetical protein SAMN05421758_1211 [Salimicrobium salexigens]|uniref:Uncharacterized protein n=1 Tax=Salimicrobium salexigens TaxID=908941 RepID=A0ABY1L0C7_9BACI|nr:hypothetical protein SAMN05421758_1211 [Salimicrobium salexigens]